MGRSRQRNKRTPPYRKPVRPVVQVSVACPGGTRPGIDPRIIVQLQKLDRLVRGMRIDIGVPNGAWDEESAIKRYLAYLSMLVDVALADMVISAVHNNDLAVIMKQRMLVEYSAKGRFYNIHRDRALHLMTIDEARSVLNKVRESDPESPSIDALEKDYEEKKATFAAVIEAKPKSLKDIMIELAINPVDPGTVTDGEYYFIYGAPSALMHGEPEGLRFIFDRDEEGNEKPKITVTDDQLNAMLVDAGRNTLFFCDTFIDCFHDSDSPLVERLRALSKAFQVLLLRHPHGRDDDVLEEVRAELVGDGTDYEKFSLPLTFGT